MTISETDLKLMSPELLAKIQDVHELLRDSEGNLPNCRIAYHNTALDNYWCEFINDNDAVLALDDKNGPDFANITVEYA